MMSCVCRPAGQNETAAGHHAGQLLAYYVVKWSTCSHFVNPHHRHPSALVKRKTKLPVNFAISGAGEADQVARAGGVAVCMVYDPRRAEPASKCLSGADGSTRAHTVRIAAGQVVRPGSGRSPAPGYANTRGRSLSFVARYCSLVVPTLSDSIASTTR